MTYNQVFIDDRIRQIIRKHGWSLREGDENLPEDHVRRTRNNLFWEQLLQDTAVIILDRPIDVELPRRMINIFEIARLRETSADPTDAYVATLNAILGTDLHSDRGPRAIIVGFGNEECARLQDEVLANAHSQAEAEAVYLREECRERALVPHMSNLVLMKCPAYAGEGWKIDLNGKTLCVANYDSQTGPGDSGGPLFLITETGEEDSDETENFHERGVLAGTASFGDSKRNLSMYPSFFYNAGLIANTVLKYGGKQTKRIAKERGCFEKGAMVC